MVRPSPVQPQYGTESCSQVAVKSSDTAYCPGVVPCFTAWSRWSYVRWGNVESGYGFVLLSRGIVSHHVVRLRFSVAQCIIVKAVRCEMQYRNVTVQQSVVE